jgi:antitoxin VapB
LTIDDDQADTLARRLAALTGEAVGTAVMAAIRERLERLENVQSEERLLADVHPISARFRQHLPQPMTSLDHGDRLDDEHGLPR